MASRPEDVSGARHLHGEDVVALLGRADLPAPLKCLLPFQGPALGSLVREHLISAGPGWLCWGCGRPCTLSGPVSGCPLGQPAVVRPPPAPCAGWLPVSPHGPSLSPSGLIPCPHLAPQLPACGSFLSSPPHSPLTQHLHFLPGQTLTLGLEATWGEGGRETPRDVTRGVGPGGNGCNAHLGQDAPECGASSQARRP